MEYNNVEGIRLGNVFFSYNLDETVSAEILSNVIVFKNTTIEPTYDNIDVLSHDADIVVTTLAKYCFTIAPNIGISAVQGLQCSLDSKITYCNFEQLKCSYNQSIFNNHICSLHVNDSLKCSWDNKLDTVYGDLSYSNINHCHNYITTAFNVLVVDGIEYSINDNINIEGCGLQVSFNPNTKTLLVCNI